jgi:phosphate transport system ATP-binding protein
MRGAVGPLQDRVRPTGRGPPVPQDPDAPILTVTDYSLWYGERQALDGINLTQARKGVLALIGPSGCGKSTLLRALNRMNDHIPGVRRQGRILFDGMDVDGDDIDPPVLRRRFGWVAQKPNPFPDSVRENVAYGPRLHGVAPEEAMEAHVAACLTRAGLWEELRDRLDEPGDALSGGQQQRLCIARALSTEPDVLLMDEPCGSIDPIATARIEALIGAIARDRAVIVITHNMAQARRVADRVGFMDAGRLLELGPTERVFAAPEHPRCAAYLSGRYG